MKPIRTFKYASSLRRRAFRISPLAVLGDLLRLVRRWLRTHGQRRSRGEMATAVRRRNRKLLSSRSVGATGTDPEVLHRSSVAQRSSSPSLDGLRDQRLQPRVTLIDLEELNSFFTPLVRTKPNLSVKITISSNNRAPLRPPPLDRRRFRRARRLLLLLLV